MTNYPHVEKKLLSKVSKGDEAAFAQLYTFWEPHLSSFIFRITKSRDIASEVVQDIFLKIWMNREALGEIASFKSFLFVISRNHAINAFKKAMREIRHLHRIDNEPHEVHEAPGDEHEEFAYSLLDQAIDQLPPRQKEVYLLHKHDRLSYQEISEKLSIGKESVKTHIGLAIKSIKKYLIENISSITLLILFFKK
jgi:RNA polymerase sigma-70 factor (family 1)